MEKAGDILKTLFSDLKIDLEKTAAPVFSAWGGYRWLRICSSFIGKGGQKGAFDRGG